MAEPKKATTTTKSLSISRVSFKIFNINLHQPGLLNTHSVEPTWQNVSGERTGQNNPIVWRKHILKTAGFDGRSGAVAGRKKNQNDVLSTEMNLYWSMTHFEWRKYKNLNYDFSDVPHPAAVAVCTQAMADSKYMLSLAEQCSFDIAA